MGSILVLEAKGRKEDRDKAVGGGSLLLSAEKQARLLDGGAGLVPGICEDCGLSGGCAVCFFLNLTSLILLLCVCVCVCVHIF